MRRTIFFGLAIAIWLLLPRHDVAAQPFTFAQGASYHWGPANAVVASPNQIIVAHNEGVRVYANDSFGGYPFLGGIVTDAPVRDLALAGTIVYAATASGAIDIISLANPSHPVIVGIVILPDTLVALDVVGARLIAATRTALYTYDIGTLSAPVRLSSCHCTESVVAMSASDSLVVAAQGSAGALGVRLHADGTMETGASYRGPDSNLIVEHAVTNGRYAFIPDHLNGLRIVDFADPDSPVQAGLTVTFGDVQDAAIAGDRLMLADATYGLLSYRLGNPANPSWQDETDQLGGMMRVWPGAGSQFIVSQGNDLMVISASLLGDIAYLGRFAPPGHYASTARQGRWNYVSDVFGIWHVRPDSVYGDSSVTRIGGSEPVWDLMVSGGRLFSASGERGTRIYNVTSSGNLQPIRTIPPERQSSLLAKAGNRLTVVENGYGFKLYDISTIFLPQEIGLLRRARTFTSVAMPNEDFVYIGERGGAVGVYDLEHVIKPERLGSLPRTVTTYDLLISGGTMYAADLVNGLLVFSLANPAAPALVSETPVPGGARSLLLSGRTMYVGGGDGTLFAFDIRDLSSPYAFTSTRLPSPIVGLTKFGEQLWPVTETAIHTVDVLQPLLPGDVNCDNSVDALDLTALVDYLYITGVPPFRPNAADVNGDARTNLIDVVWLIDYLFRGRSTLLPGIVE